MKIYIPNSSKQSIGGGWTFLRNFKKGGDFEFVDNWKDSDLILITGATMTNRNEMMDAKRDGKKIVFRVDNIPRDSRNRGTAFSRMLDFAKICDYIVFQSEWARDYAGWWFVDKGVDITCKSSIIYNGVDKEFFYKDDTPKRNDKYIFVQYNRDENKRMTEAFYLFHQNVFKKNREAQLFLVGRFSPEMVENNFDFFAGEQVTYLGVIEDQKELGKTFRECSHLLFPAFADASPNTVMEAMACGCEIVGVNETGGTKELINIKNRSIQDMGKDYKEVFEKVLCKLD